MECFEEEFDKTKYFLDENKNKIYARKGNGHKKLSYRIMRELGLDTIYYHRYEKRLPPALFLIYGGYVLVDEAEERYNQSSWDAPVKVTKYTTVGYCSAAIDEGYIKYIKDTYDKKGNIIDDCYKTDDVRMKKIIDEVIELFKEYRESQKTVEEEEER